MVFRCESWFWREPCTRTARPRNRFFTRSRLMGSSDVSWCRSSCRIAATIFRQHIGHELSVYQLHSRRMQWPLRTLTCMLPLKRSVRPQRCCVGNPRVCCHGEELFPLARPPAFLCCLNRGGLTWELIHTPRLGTFFRLALVSPQSNKHSFCRKKTAPLTSGSRCGMFW
jgi:hypothetical protein